MKLQFLYAKLSAEIRSDMRVMKHINFTKVSQLDNKTKEAYKTLRTNISFCGDEIKTILFTSSVPNEGKSRVSFETARAFAEDGKRVLYVDADIRKSVLVARYEVDAEIVGLTHYLAGKMPLEDVIYETNIERFNCIFTGAAVPNPAELLGKSRLEKLIAEKRDAYDYIIFDCPPLASVIDAAVVARHCDGAILVVESNNISYRVVQQVKKQLQKSGCRILGVVLNKVETAGKSYYGKYYEKYYGRYHDDYHDE